MVRLSSVLTAVSLGFLASADAYNPLYKRYDNSTCDTATAVSTSVVDVYGPAYTGAVSNQYTKPVVEASWSNNGPVFTVFIPQQLLNLTGLDLQLQSATNVEYESSSFVLYSGDINNFVYPGQIYSTSAKGLVFDGKTQAPLLKIVATGNSDSSAPYFAVVFELAVDYINPASVLGKRDVEVYTLTGSISNPNYSTSSSSSSSSSTSSATATGATTSSASSTDATTSSASSTGATSSSSTSTGAGSPNASSASTSSSAAAAGAGSTSTHVVIGSTITETITSCSDNKCSEHKVTAVGSVIVTTVNDVVTSYSTYCPLPATPSGGVDVPTAKTVYPVEQTVTVGDYVTVITTVCPESATAVSATITKPNGEQTVVTITDFKTVSVTSPTAATPVATAVTATSATGATTTTHAAVTAATTGPVYVPVEQSSSVEATGTAISVYQGAAAGKSGYLNGGIVGIIGLFMML